ncbi:hypothetical protein [Dolichospermum circinale]|uniref:hypothetical protein n=1 Tax=Dolichospermum circinale TaxID=109265 RepID=UPI00232BBF3B|nr:hypothetical protein [Dolichospermum circinale]MDB9448906.1 hypothetical protein [Dolichospermum circinale CS-547]
MFRAKAQSSEGAKEEGSRSHALYGNELRKALPSLILSSGGRSSKWYSQSLTGNEEYYLQGALDKAVTHIKCLPDVY